MWRRAVTRIVTPGGPGSGVFISDDVVLTAAHVVEPLGGARFATTDIVVCADDGPCAVCGVAVHPDWAASRRRNADVALLKVTRSAPASIRCLYGFGDDGSLYPVAAGGFPANDTTLQTLFGHVARDGTNSTPFMYVTNDLAVVPGISGGPVVVLDPEAAVIGVAVWAGAGVAYAVALQESELELVRASLA